MFLCPNTWSCLNNPAADSIYSKVSAEAKRLGLLKDGVIIGVYRMRKDLKPYGECRWERKNGVTKCSIGLNERILGVEEVIRAVLVHEVAHACTPGANHSAKWKRAGDSIGSKFGISVNRTEDYSPYGVADYTKKEVKKYAIQCPKCGRKWEYSRLCGAVKSPETYRCCKCNIGLLRVK